MRRTIAILGTLLIAAVFIISGSAVAQTHWVTYYSDTNCTSVLYIESVPDTDHASLGQNNPQVLGIIVTDLGPGNEMGPNQQFKVVAGSDVSENYTVSVSETAEDDGVEVGSGEDTEDHNFYTPSTPNMEWRYIILTGTSGYQSYSEPDWAYGPDIDAVGW